MDLKLYGRVILRFWLLILLGVVLAVVLAILSVAKFTHGGLVYRKPAIWQSTSTVILTQHGFPWGRATFPLTTDAASQFGDPGRFSSLTDLYARFANSDDVKAIMLRDGAKRTWTLTAAAVLPSNPGGTLPVISLAGQAYTPSEAVRATKIGRQAFLQYVHSQQQSAAIPVAERVDIETLVSATAATVVAPRKKTLPIVILLAILSATFGLAFVLENARPRKASGTVERLQPQEPDQAATRAARSQSGA